MDLLVVLSRIWMLMCLKWPYVTVVSYMYTDCIWHSVVLVPHRIGGNLKLLRESTNADRKRLKIAFLIANCRFRLPVCNPKRCCNAYRSALLDSHDSSVATYPVWLRINTFGTGVGYCFIFSYHITYHTAIPGFIVCPSCRFTWMGV